MQNRGIDGLTPRQRYYYKNREACLAYGKEYLPKWKLAHKKKVKAHAKKNYRSFLGRLKKTYTEMVKRRPENILSESVFIQWSSASDKYKELYSNWVKSKYQRKIAPSIDRINPHYGYQLHNMQWITHGENARKGNLERKFINELSRN